MIPFGVTLFSFLFSFLFAHIAHLKSAVIIPRHDMHGTRVAISPSSHKCSCRSRLGRSLGGSATSFMPLGSRALSRALRADRDRCDLQVSPEGERALSLTVFAARGVKIPSISW